MEFPDPLSSSLTLVYCRREFDVPLSSVCCMVSAPQITVLAGEKKYLVLNLRRYGQPRASYKPCLLENIDTCYYLALQKGGREKVCMKKINL